MKISAIKNNEKGKDIFILGNAPSIKKHNLNKLKNRVSIGINSSPILESHFDFSSQYYVVSDKRFFQEKKKHQIATDPDIQKQRKRILRDEIRPLDSPNLKNNTSYIKALRPIGFSFDLERGFYFGSTTALMAIQVACYLGAKDIYLLGVDFCYDASNPRFYLEETPQEWDTLLDTQIRSIIQAQKALKERRINLFNCSPSSLLRAYIPFKDF